MGAARAAVAQARGIGAEHAPDLITHAAKNGEDLLLGAPGLSGIIETPMVALHLPREDRANLIRPAADGDHRVDRTVAELVEMLRAVTGGIEAELDGVDIIFDDKDSTDFKDEDFADAFISPQ